MNEKKNNSLFKDVLILLFVGLLVALIMGLSLRPFVANAAAPPGTSSDAGITVATSSDSSVDSSPYLTNDVTLLQTNDLLLSIRNILVCIWGTLIVFWAYSRMKAIISRLGGYKKDV